MKKRKLFAINVYFLRVFIVSMGWFHDEPFTVFSVILFEKMLGRPIFITIFQIQIAKFMVGLYTGA